MCKPAPGPRCAAHTSAALTAAQSRLDAALTALGEFVEARRTGRDGQFTLGASQSVHDEVADARAALSAAQADHDATPSGQAGLRAAIETMENSEEPDADEIMAAYERLTTGQARREQAKADLLAAQEQAFRLQFVTAEEREHLLRADAALAAAEGGVAVAEDDLAVAEYEAVPFQREADRLGREYADAQAEVSRLKNTVEIAALNVKTELRRIYEAGGVPARMASYYADDSVDFARETRPSLHGGAHGPVVRPVEVKVKRSGPDREATLAARALAADDTGLATANATLDERVASLARARADLSSRVGARYDEAMARSAEASRTAMHAREALTDAEHRRAAATGDRDRLYARVGAGIGAGSVRQVAISRAGDEIVRNPDGTINAYVYRAPSPGFPHGRMARATDITTVTGGFSPVNALVLEDGTTVSASTHHYRNHTGARTDTSDPLVVLTPARDGATPLRAESVAAAGFASFADSTD